MMMELLRVQIAFSKFRYAKPCSRTKHCLWLVISMNWQLLVTTSKVQGRKYSKTSIVVLHQVWEVDMQLLYCICLVLCNLHISSPSHSFYCMYKHSRCHARTRTGLDYSLLQHGVYLLMDFCVLNLVGTLLGGILTGLSLVYSATVALPTEVLKSCLRVSTIDKRLGLLHLGNL